MCNQVKIIHLLQQQRPTRFLPGLPRKPSQGSLHGLGPCLKGMDVLKKAGQPTELGRLAGPRIRPLNQ